MTPRIAGRTGMARAGWQGQAKDNDLLKDRILFLDGEAIVIDKPAGLPVDPPRDGSLSLENHIDSLKLGFKRWPTAVHRLDRDTSGCLLLARNPKAHARFQQAFEQGLVEKVYLAVLDGVPEGRRGEIDLPLAKVSTKEAGWRMVGDAAARWGQGGADRMAVAPHGGRAVAGRVPARDRADASDPGPRRRRAGRAGGGRSDLWPAPGRTGRCSMPPRLVVPRGEKPPVEADAPLPERFVAAAGFGECLKSRADALEEKFLAATGPGGQNVNKVATACQLRVDGYRLGLDPETWRRLRELAGSRMTAGGTIVITARRFRTQEANRADARQRLEDLLTAGTPPRPAPGQDQAEPGGESEAGG